MGKFISLAFIILIFIIRISYLLIKNNKISFKPDLKKLQHNCVVIIKLVGLGLLLCVTLYFTYLPLFWLIMGYDFTAKWGVSIGFTCFALGTLMYSVLIISSYVLPRLLGGLGIIASTFTFGTWLPRIDEGLDPIAMALFLPMVLWLFGLGIWLLLIGTRDDVELTDTLN